MGDYQTIVMSMCIRVSDLKQISVSDSILAPAVEGRGKCSPGKSVQATRSVPARFMLQRAMGKVHFAHVHESMENTPARSNGRALISFREDRNITVCSITSQDGRPVRETSSAPM